MPAPQEHARTPLRGRTRRLQAVCGSSAPDFVLLCLAMLTAVLAPRGAWGWALSPAGLRATGRATCASGNGALQSAADGGRRAQFAPPCPPWRGPAQGRRGVAALTAQAGGPPQNRSAGNHPAPRTPRRLTAPWRAAPAGPAGRRRTGEAGRRDQRLREADLGERRPLGAPLCPGPPPPPSFVLIGQAASFTPY